MKISQSALLLILLISITSCTQSKKKNLEHLIFRYNESSNITSLDPAFAKVQSNIWACNQLFNGLVQLDDSLHIQPCIAKKWEISEDGLTYRFILRDNVYFHKHVLFNTPDSTRKVNATDFEFSFNRLTDEKTASPGSWILQNADYFKALNDTVFQIKLKQPFPGFLGLLTMQYATVVPKEIITHPGYSFRTNPIGTGPFYFKFWEENVKLVFRKNPYYFETDQNGIPLPHLEAVAITFLPDKQSGFLEFVQGKIDFVSGLDPSYKDEILTQTGELQSTYKHTVNLETSPYLNTEYLGFRMDGKNKTLSDIRIRQALNYGFDRGKMVLYLRNNMGIPATSGIIPSGMPGFVPGSGYDFDPEKAKKLVAAYKEETGEKTITITLNTNASYIDIAEFLQREWQKIGIRTVIDVNPPSTLRQAIATGKVDFFRASWIADYPDAENYLSLFYSKNFAPNGPNYTHFSHPYFDQLYEKAFKETNDSRRWELYRKMDSIIIQEAPVIPLFYDKVARFSRKNIENLSPNPLNLLHLKKVKKL